MFEGRECKRNVTVHWFRHGLRFHDNPALLKAIKNSSEFYAIFIFDGDTADVKNIGYNRMRFLLESLNDLDKTLKANGGCLYMFQGNPRQVFQRLWEERCINKICFEQDSEPIWRQRDDDVKAFCQETGVQFVEKVSHTLWDPNLVIETNGGVPPLTYQMFLHTVSVIGLPPRPAKDADLSKVNFGKLPQYLLEEFKAFDSVPKPEYFGLTPEAGERMVRWVGGEQQALKHLQERLKVEEKAFREGFYLSNQARPDLLAPPTSQSAALRHGCLSVRRFYWSIHDLFEQVHKGSLPSTQSITGQLIWREYFYTMSVNNPHYAEMEANPICLNIDWLNPNDPVCKTRLERWKMGMTGYPFIDACMRQLLQEGWIHHVARNAVACFLTRGDLWVSWEAGLEHFLKYLLDADWSVCAGNWMWVTSSAFEQLLDCSVCICPVNFGRRFDPYGEYIRRYVPEIRNLPVEYIYNPWVAPLEIQERANCVVGRDYPERIVDHKIASTENARKMEEIRRSLLSNVPHCCPSNTEEVRQFMWLQEQTEHCCMY